MNSHSNTITPELVEEQLRRIQSSPLFSHSRRYPSFLDYVVRKTLDGQGSELKERTVGIEAFGRPSSYDLNADPIVRVTAGEVRKRLAQYYYEPTHQSELRIELHPGSYVPEFRFEDRAKAESLPRPLPLEAPSSLEKYAAEPFVPAAISAEPRQTRAARWLISAGALVVLGSLFAWGLTRRTLVDQFWSPVLSSSGPVLISVGSVVAMNPQDTDPADASSVGGHPLSTDPIALSDAVAISGIQQVLSAHSRNSTIQSSATTTFSDLQKGPAILISGFDNQWTVRLTDPLRFHMVRTTADEFAIEDRTDPSHRRWGINTFIPFTKITHDYGLVARYMDPTTDQMVVVVAGIGENGTIAASQFLSSDKYMAELKQNSLFPAKQQNFEAVIETQIIDGKPGPPRVLATHTW